MSAVLVEREGNLLTIKLNRPERGNAIDFPLAEGLSEAMTQVDASVRVVLLAAEGKNFCVGGDLGEFGAAEQPGEFLTELATQLHVAVKALAALDVPLVVAVQGAAGGAGMSLALLGDVVVCGKSSKLRPAYLAIGLTPDGGMSWSLPQRLGNARFMDLLMTGDLLTAEQALAAGVVSRVVEDGEVWGEAYRLAKELEQGPTESFRRLKTLVREGADRSLSEQLDAEAIGIGASADSADGREGVAAFLERRPAKFGG